MRQTRSVVMPRARARGLSSEQCIRQLVAAQIRALSSPCPALALLLCQHEHMFTHYNATPVIILSILDMMFAGLLAPCTISDGRKILSTSHGYLYDTGVDKGGPEGPGPPIAGQKRIFLLK